MKERGDVTLITRSLTVPRRCSIFEPRIMSCIMLGRHFSSG